MAALPVSSDRRLLLDVPRPAGGLRGFLGVHPGLLAVAAAALLVPWYLSTYWVYTVTVGLVLAISCLGLLVVVGWVREISLAQAGLTGSAACLAFYALHVEGLREGGVPFPLAAAYAIAGVVALSLLVALVSMRLAAAYVVVLTLALQFALENTVLVNDHLRGGGMADWVIERPNFFGRRMLTDESFYYFVLGTLVVSMVFLHRLRISRFGRLFHA